MHLDNNVIRELRLDLGWTQQQLADACGVSMRTVQRVEKDGLASLETTTALGVVFGVDRRALLRISPAEEIKTVSAGRVRLLALGVLLGFIVGVLVTLALFSYESSVGKTPAADYEVEENPTGVLAATQETDRIRAIHEASGESVPTTVATSQRKTAPEGAVIRSIVLHDQVGLRTVSSTLMFVIASMTSA